MRLWFARGRVVEPALGRVEERDLFVEDGRVVEAPSTVDGSWERVDCEGLVVAPGLVDLHARLADLERDGRAAIAGGFTTVVMSPAQPRPLDDPSYAKNLLHRARDRVPCRLELAGAATEGLKGEGLAEMGTLIASGCRVLSQGVEPIRSTRVLRSVLEYAGRFRCPLFLRAVDVDLERGVIREGERSVVLGLPGVPPEAEELGVLRIGVLSRLTGTAVHLTHLWSRRGVDAVRRLRADGVAITASTLTHHLILDDTLVEESAYSGSSRFLPVLGDAEDRAALVEGLRDGTLQAVATDHLPLAPFEQDVEMQEATPGAVALETAFSLVLQASEGDLLTTFGALASGPARVLGLEHGSLAPGAMADLVVVDPDERWVVSRASSYASQSNTPLMDRTLRGRVRMTIVGGVVVHRSDGLPHEGTSSDHT